MVTEGNGTASAVELRIESLYSPSPEDGETPWLDSQTRRHAQENLHNGAEDPFPLAPIVDKIAHGIAKGLVTAIKELEVHIADEARRTGEYLARRIDTLQASVDEVTSFAGEQRSAGNETQEQLRQLTNDVTGLREADTHQAAELERLGAEARDFSKSVWERIESMAASVQESDAHRASDLETLRTGMNDLNSSVTHRIDDLCSNMGQHHEDVASLKGLVHDFGPRLDALVARMDRHADAFRAVHAAVSQRDTEMEQIVEGLARITSQRISLETNEL